jgi:thiol-disulfide isomerase/thioredoxin
MNKTTIQPIHGVGGSPTLIERVKGFLSNWQSLAIILISILLVIIGYYTYTEYSKNSTTFNANREQGSKDTNSDKSASLMLFYVDWCPHCKTAKPEWEELKAEYDGKSINGYNVSFVEYNCTNENAEVSQLMDTYNIEGYPTIKLIKDNQVIEYDAKPTKSTMEQFLNTVL